MCMNNSPQLWKPHVFSLCTPSASYAKHSFQPDFLPAITAPGHFRGTWEHSMLLLPVSIPEWWQPWDGRYWSITTSCPVLQRFQHWSSSSLIPSLSFLLSFISKSSAKSFFMADKHQKAMHSLYISYTDVYCSKWVLISQSIASPPKGTRMV